MECQIRVDDMSLSGTMRSLRITGQKKNVFFGIASLQPGDPGIANFLGHPTAACPRSVKHAGQKCPHPNHGLFTSRSRSSMAVHHSRRRLSSAVKFCIYNGGRGVAKSSSRRTACKHLYLEANVVRGFGVTRQLYVGVKGPEQAGRPCFCYLAPSTAVGNAKKKKRHATPAPLFRTSAAKRQFGQDKQVGLQLRHLCSSALSATNGAAMVVASASSSEQATEGDPGLHSGGVAALPNSLQSQTRPALNAASLNFHLAGGPRPRLSLGSGHRDPPCRSVPRLLLPSPIGRPKIYRLVREGSGSFFHCRVLVPSTYRRAYYPPTQGTTLHTITSHVLHVVRALMPPFTLVPTTCVLLRRDWTDSTGSHMQQDRDISWALPCVSTDFPLFELFTAPKMLSSVCVSTREWATLYSNFSKFEL